MNRYRLRVPADDAELALARMLELFPAGVEEERDGPDVVLAGYADEPPAPGLEPEAVDARLGGRAGGRSTGRPRRAALDRATVVRDAQAHRGRHRPGARVRHRGARLDPSRPRAARRLEPSAALDLGCGSGVLVDRRLELGFGPLQALRPRPAGGRRDGRERRPKRRRGRGRPGRRPRRPAAGRAALAREPRAGPAPPAARARRPSRADPGLGAAADQSARRVAGGSRSDGWAAEVVDP